VFIKPLIYVTIAEVRETGKLSCFDDEDTSIYIGKSESIIDNIISHDFIDTPIAIKQAVILLAERISQYSESEKIVTSEKRRGNAVTYETRGNIYASLHPCMNAEIYNLLKPYMTSNTFFRT
jgi:hypothetical protein